MTTWFNPRIDAAVSAYVFARSRVIRFGYLHEIQWQNEKQASAMTETCFLEQFAWVTLSSGMRESVVRSRFDRVRTAFNNFQSALDILNNGDSYIDEAFISFRHRQKLSAIKSAAIRIEEFGFDEFKRRLLEIGPTALLELPFMGPATSLHLAKNLGMDVAKPDRHLIRIASSAGYSSVQDLCSDVAKYVGERIAVVDVVFWRYATLTSDYIGELLQLFRDVPHGDGRYISQSF